MSPKFKEAQGWRFKCQASASNSMTRLGKQSMPWTRATGVDVSGAFKDRERRHQGKPEKKKPRAGGGAKG